MINEINFPSVESPGVYGPQDYSLQSLNFISSSGPKIDLRKLMVEFSFYEDLYAFSVSGSVTIKDAQGFIELLSLTGNEYIEVDFGKVKNAPNTIKGKYRVYKIGNRTPTGNLNSESYVLYFCSEELMLSEQLKISKTVKGKKVSDIIKIILTNELQVGSKRINLIEDTTGVYDFVVPRLKPFEAISWVSTYARPANNSDGADMLFFETKDGFNFRSLQSLYGEKPYATYKYQPQNLDLDQQSFQDKVTSVLSYQLVKSYNSLEDIQSGTFANKLISVDPLSRTFKTTTFDMEKYRASAKTLNSGSPTNYMENRFGVKQNQAYDSSIKVAITNSPQQNVKYIKERQGSTAKDVFIETYIPKRTAQLALANYTVLKAIIPGDPGITVGRVVQFNVMTLKPNSNKKELDKFYSGNYLVTAVRHIIQAHGIYQTVLELSKDSSKTDHSTGNSSTPSWKSAVSG